MSEWILSPFVVLRDTREQQPYSFQGINADAKDGAVPIIVQVEDAVLKSGDYSIKGFEDKIAVERKSLKDLYGTLGKGRERFERELDRFRFFFFSAVVIESSMANMILHPPFESRMRPKSIYRSILAYQQRFPTRWIFACNRRLAEVTTYQILRRWWIDQDAKEATNAQDQTGNRSGDH